MRSGLLQELSIGRFTGNPGPGGDGIISGGPIDVGGGSFRPQINSGVPNHDAGNEAAPSFTARRTEVLMIRRFGVFVIALSSLTVSLIAVGNDIISNGTFDVDVLGWTPNPDATVSWYPVDADGDPGSGSALVGNIANYSTTLGAQQCAQILVDDSDYTLRAVLYVPSGQTGTGYGYLSVRLYDLPNCLGNQLLSDFSSVVHTSTVDEWIETDLALFAQSGAQSALIAMAVFKNEATDPLEIAFDNIRMFPVGIFADGFEDGDLRQWSGTQP